MDQICNSRISKKTVRILVLGKDGSGKSTLINSMLEEELAYENHSLTSVIGKNGMIEQHIKKVDHSETEVVMYDTTAVNDFKDGLIHGIQVMGGIEAFDAVLFCCSALQRVDSETESLMATLHESFGKQLWEKTVFVLTFVNVFLSLHSVKIHMAESAKGEAVHQLVTSLREGLVSRTSVGRCFIKVPVMPAGCDKNMQGFPLIKWHRNLWKECINSIKIDSKFSLLKVVRVKSIENTNPQFKSVRKEVLFGAATGAVLGTAISPVMGTVLVSATGAVIGGVSAAYSNRRTRRAIRIVNSITLSENICEHDHDLLQSSDVVNTSLQPTTTTTMSSHTQCTTDQRQEHQQYKHGGKTMNAVLKVTTTQATVSISSTTTPSSKLKEDGQGTTIGNFAEEILERFSLSSSV